MTAFVGLNFYPSFQGTETIQIEYEGLPAISTVIVYCQGFPFPFREYYVDGERELSRWHPAGFLGNAVFGVMASGLLCMAFESVKGTASYAKTHRVADQGMKEPSKKKWSSRDERVSVPDEAAQEPVKPSEEPDELKP